MNVDDYMTWEHHIEDPFFANLRSIASVPLKVEQKVIGILGLGFLESERGFRRGRPIFAGAFCRSGVCRVGQRHIAQDLIRKKWRSAKKPRLL